ncbi:PH domain-containing protein [Mycobacterium sp. MYCO198283]|uniref:PH domain-containing protein n=1 Tax=Mycobacterium sp. MYCO198283 TaxID=2883505 RepID=UPI001E2DBB5D|nr:PH domain-containing protein [Mycobacterium sp. MYCO198283]MCG5433074.1 PH domain-containing protein [Mycobacterium sp. MYCO198283]
MQQTSWQPSTGAVAAFAVGGVMMAVAAVTLVTDAPGRLLASIAAAGLLVFAGFSLRARPKLAISEAGLTIRGWLRTQLLRRDDISLIRITEFRRIGRKVRLLEIDTINDRLIVLSRWDLGTDPLDVLDALTEAGYAPGRR